MMYFDNLAKSYVTLFELMVVSTWEIMEGYSNPDMAGRWSLIYFISFYLISMIILTIIVAFMLDAFLFKIEYKNKTKQDGFLLEKKQIVLNREEVKLLNYFYTKCHKNPDPEIQKRAEEGSDLEFEGRNILTKEEIQAIMNRENITNWIRDSDIGI